MASIMAELGEYRLRRRAWGLPDYAMEMDLGGGIGNKSRRRTEIHLQKKKVNYLILPVVLNRMYLVA